MVSRDSQLKLSTVGPVVDDLFGDRVIHSQRRIILVHACYSSWTLHPWRHGILFFVLYQVVLAVLLVRFWFPRASCFMNFLKQCGYFSRFIDLEESLIIATLSFFFFLLSTYLSSNYCCYCQVNAANCRFVHRTCIITTNNSSPTGISSKKQPGSVQEKKK